MARFSLEKKGYNKSEVDSYIQKTVTHLENKISEQAERITQLKEEVNYLYQRNDEYRRNEEKVSSALIKVMEFKEHSENELKEQNELELERLKFFREKWTRYAYDVQKSQCKDVVDKLNNYIYEFTIELKNSLKVNLNIPSIQPTRAVEEYFSEQERVKNEQKMSVQDAKESEKLIKMCRNLGLLDED